ncbi:MAG: hypothetical protein ACFUZC_12715 [Chthoniobacteraceae bacterium]
MQLPQASAFPSSLKKAEVSRKGAKPQRGETLAFVFFAPLRLCAFAPLRENRIPLFFHVAWSPTRRAITPERLAFRKNRVMVLRRVFFCRRAEPKANFVDLLHRGDKYFSIYYE